MVRVMMKQVVSLCAASFAFFFLSGCDRAPSSGEKRAAPSAEREKPSAVRKEAEIWRERLDAAVAGAGREKENGSEHIAPLIRPKKEDELARRFDYLVYSIDLGLLQSKSIQSPVNIVVQTAEKLSAKYSIPQVEKKKEIIEKVQTNEFWDKVTIIELDTVREALRGLLQYLDRQVRPIYYTNFTDSITDGTPGEPLYGGNDLKNYRKKVEFYLKEHSDKLSVYKLKNNKKLTETDLRELERILWTELGSKEDYIKEYGETPIGRLVRKIVGVDRAAVNEAFSCFMSEERLNINQMRFVNLIVDYIVANGNIEDNKVLMGEPFKSVGSITTLFKDDMSTAKQIMEIVNQIKRNSEEIA